MSYLSNHRKLDILLGKFEKRGIRQYKEVLGTLCQPWNLTIFKALIWLIPGKNFPRYLILTPFCLLYTDIPSFLGWKLHSAGEEVWEIFDSLPETETGEDFVTAVNALKTYFQPKQNKCFEHHILLLCTARSWIHW